jgi:hypothetical protein
MRDRELAAYADPRVWETPLWLKGDCGRPGKKTWVPR